MEVLHRLEAYLSTLDNKLSYKKGHGSDVCVATDEYHCVLHL